MGVTIGISLPGQEPADTLALPVAQPIGGEGARIVDEKLGGRLARLTESGELRGERGEAVVLHLSGELAAPRLVAAGVGPRETVDADALRTAGAVAAQSVARVGGTILWLLDETLPLPLPEQAAALVEGTVLGAYSPGRWKTGDGNQPVLERIVIGHVEDGGLRDAAERAVLLAEQANRARDLANMPPNELDPQRLAEHAQELAGEHEHLTADVLGPGGDGASSAWAPSPRSAAAAAASRASSSSATTRRSRHAPTCCSASSARRSPSTRAGSRSSRRRAWRT